MNNERKLEDLTLDEMQEHLINGFFKLRWKLIKGSECTIMLAQECLKYHHNLYVRTLDDLFYFQSERVLTGTLLLKVEPTSYFVARLKKAFFKDPMKPKELLKNRKRFAAVPAENNMN